MLLRENARRVNVERLACAVRMRGPEFWVNAFGAMSQFVLVQTKIESSPSTLVAATRKGGDRESVPALSCESKPRAPTQPRPSPKDNLSARRIHSRAHIAPPLRTPGY